MKTTPSHTSGAVALLLVGAPAIAETPNNAEQYLIVDCQLPGQLRKLGTRSVYLSARRPARLPARDCQIRGGEFVAYDRADARSALAAWLPDAERGDRDAQTIVGEIYERGFGVEPDYSAAAGWYQRAAEAGDRRAQVNLGHLLEKGLGTPADARTAIRWYRRAAGLTDAIELDNPELIDIVSVPRKTEIEIAGPQLALIEPIPERTRDIVAAASAQVGARPIIGRVTAPAGIVALTINDVPVSITERNIFSGSVDVAAPETLVRIVAVDRQGKRGELRFNLRVPQAPVVGEPQISAIAARDSTAASVDFGTYHALIIGNSDYEHLPKLATPLNDAVELATLLERRYGFKTTVLKNATRYQILTALNQLRESLTPRDNLLIYFAGHGELDEPNQRGHWLPIDAERESTANWIATPSITDILNVMRAKQVLLVVDSCYAGALTRSSLGRLRTGMTGAERRHWLRTMATRRSRTVLTSGGIAPVMDGGGGGHSVFARALLEVLATNQEALDGQKLHREVAARVAYAAANQRFDQVPEYAPIRFAGHEAGEFFLVPRN
jgi:hypothetical protein